MYGIQRENSSKLAAWLLKNVICWVNHLFKACIIKLRLLCINEAWKDSEMGNFWVSFQLDNKGGKRLAQFLLIFCPSVKPVETDMYHFQFHYPLLIRCLKETSYCLQIVGKIWANEAHFEKLVNICSFSRSFFALSCRFVTNLNMFYEFCSSKGPITEEWSDKVHIDSQDWYQMQILSK